MSVSAARHDHHRSSRGLWRGLFATRHEHIGTLYLWFSVVMFLTGGLLALVMRAELMYPGMQVIEPALFRQIIMIHGVVMVFGAILPASLGLANRMIPRMIGAPDMALPRVSHWAFRLLVLAFILLVVAVLYGIFAADNPADIHSDNIRGSALTELLVLSVLLIGVAFILGAINVIATVLGRRTPDMTLMKMPLFVWSWLITALLLLAIMPVLAGHALLLLADHYLDTGFLDAGDGGQALFQSVIWFFEHPGVYIMVLPAFGIVSQILPTFARKPLFGYVSMVCAAVTIGLLSFVVWAHHLLAVLLPLSGVLFLLYVTILIAVPTGVIVFNWLATLWRGSITFELPMKWALAFVVLFTCGGLSGVLLAVTPIDFPYRDTYFVVAHLHYVLVPGAVFSLMAGVYYWLPQWTGVLPNRRLGELHFWNSLLSVNLLFFPMHLVGLAGMPRRYADYAPQFADYNFWMSVGAFWFGASQILFLIVCILCALRKGEKAPANPWQAAGREWVAGSPVSPVPLDAPPIAK